MTKLEKEESKLFEKDEHGKLRYTGNKQAWKKYMKPNISTLLMIVLIMSVLFYMRDTHECREITYNACEYATQNCGLNQNNTQQTQTFYNPNITNDITQFNINNLT